MTSPCAGPPLDRLAALHGIEPGYSDIWGQSHVTGAATRQALLAAMGVPVSTATEVSGSLDQAEAAAWREVLPPVIVMRAATPWTMLILPGSEHGRLAWTVRAGDGTTERGEVAPAALEVIGKATIEGISYQRYRLPLPRDLGHGYHRLEVTGGSAAPATAALIMAPERMFEVADLGAGERLWGITAPLYGLRSETNWGLGDFADLGQLAEVAAGRGAALVGINPVHAQLPAAPQRYSPYAPSSRRFLNVLHIAVEQVPELAQSDPARALLATTRFQAGLAAARDAKLIDYPAVAKLKLAVLERLFASLRRRRQSARWQAFEAFRASQGPSLERQALFDALYEHFHRRDPPCWSWQAWPAAYRDPASTAVARFAGAHRARVDFFAYLQWLAQEQLGAAQRRATVAGMPIGLYLDLAIGVAPDGAEAWGHPDSVVAGASLGAPPDEFNAGGQNWGLAPLSPQALRAQAYAPLIEILRGAMRHAGAIRIDHVLGLQRSFWWPAEPGVAGAYVRQPFDDLMGVIALESQRQRCVVVGEDLGTVPDGLRNALGDAGLLGCSVLYFEREQAGFHRSADYRARSVASIGTHDLPTLAGWWAGRDIDWRNRLGLYAAPDQAAILHAARHDDRQALLHLLEAEGLLPPGIDPEAPPERLPWQVVLALHRVVARSPAALMVLQIEDALGAIEQANLPGTIEAHPNWRRRLDRSVAEIGRARRFAHLAAAIAGERPARGVAGRHKQPSDRGTP
jgi:4-alpha-glucanotransferase